MSTLLVEAGDVIHIPLHHKAAESPKEFEFKRMKIHWHQYLQSRNETYDRVKVKNVTKNTEVQMFIQAEWYRIYENDEIPKEHLCNVAKKTDDGCAYELLVNCRLQYGQANVQGANRFLVYHESERLPFQHRFVPLTLDPSKTIFILNIIKSKIPQSFLSDPRVRALLEKVGNNAGDFIQEIRSLIGNGLHTFHCVHAA